MAEYWQKTIFNRVSEGTLDSFLVRFRGVFVLHCHGVLVVAEGCFQHRESWQNWQKAIFNRISEGTLDTFLVRFRGVSVLHCHGVLVWRSIGKRLFLIGFSEGTLDSFLVRFRGRVRPSLPWCFGVAEGCFQHRRQYNGKRLAKLEKRLFLILAPEAVQREKVRKIGKRLFLIGFQKGTLDTFFGAISWRVRPSLPWCFGVAEYWQKTIFNRVSEGTLDSFLVRFRGVSVLHCHGVLVWRRAVFSTGGSTTGKGWQNWQKTIFNIIERFFKTK